MDKELEEEVAETYKTGSPLEDIGYIFLCWVTTILTGGVAYLLYTESTELRLAAFAAGIFFILLIVWSTGITSEIVKKSKFIGA